MSLHGMTICITEYLTTVPDFVGRVIMFFRASMGPGGAHESFGCAKPGICGGILATPSATK